MRVTPLDVSTALLAGVLAAIVHAAAQYLRAGSADPLLSGITGALFVIGWLSLPFLSGVVPLRRVVGRPSAEALLAAGTFERLDMSRELRDVIEAGLQEARSLRHGYLGTEHLLLGLCVRPEATLRPVIGQAGLDPGGVRQAIVEIIGPGKTAGSPPTGFTRRASEVMNGAADQARSRGDDMMKPGHLLLALLSQESGIASAILDRFGIDRSRLRDEVLRCLDSSPPS